jgi:predicted transposase/invertase (TIGR01784 family)
MFSRSKELVMDLLQSAYRFNPEIESVDYINTELSAERDGAKTCRLDVAVKLADGTVIDVEVQTHQDLGIKKRSISYAAKLLSSQIECGKDDDQPDVMALFLLQHEIFPELPNEWMRSFELRDKCGCFLEERALRIDFMELLKAKSLHAEGNSVFSRWVDFFTAESFAALKVICANDATLRVAQEKLEMVSKEQQIWSDARAKWEGEWTIKQRELYAVRHAKAEGKAEGKVEGKVEGKAEAAKEAQEERRAIVRNMINEGLSRETICKVLKITDSELASLLG